MKHAMTILALLACWNAGAQVQTPFVASSLAASAPVTPVHQAASKVHEYRLDNGLTLLVQPDRRAPTAIHMAWVRVGSMDEVDGLSGLAHVVEHMMFKGTAQLAPGEFSRRVAALGGQENAFTSRDYTGYYQQIPASKLPEVMALEADRFANNRWPDEEFAKEIEVIKEERRMRTEDQPRALLFEQFYASAYNASPYRRPVVGWMSDLESMTPEDVRQFQRAWYVPSNAAVVVVGDVDPQQVLEWAQSTYGRIPAGVAPERKPRTEPAQRGIRRVQLKAPAQQAVLVMGFKVPRLTNLVEPSEADREALALVVLSAVLSGYDGARLERALMQSSPRVADSAGSSTSVLSRGPGMVVLSAIPAEGQRVETVEQALRREVQRIAEEGVGEAELRRVKTQWVASTVYEKDSISSQANDLGSNWILGLPMDASDRLLRLLQQVTPEQVQAVARKYFGDDQLTIAVLDPQPPEKAPPRAPAVPAAAMTRH